MDANAGVLTTVFTPPATCLSVVTSGAYSNYVESYSLFMAHFGEYVPASSLCYPPSTESINFLGNYYWSPGYCPMGYTTACSYTDISFNDGISASLCCPSGFSCVNGWGHVCSSTAHTTLTNVFAITTSDETLGAGDQLQTISPTPTLIVWGDGIPVAWASTDTDILELLGLLTTSSSKNLITSGSTTSISSKSSSPTSIPAVLSLSPPSQASLSSPAPSSSHSSPKIASTTPVLTSVTLITAPIPSITSASSLFDTSGITTPSTLSQSLTVSRWNGTGPLLTGYCATAEWTLIDVLTAYLWAEVVGCVGDKLDCCPFAAATTTTTTTATMTALEPSDITITIQPSSISTATNTLLASGPFPTAISGVGQTLAQCPDDYQTVSSSCCPSGYLLWTTPFDAQIPCFSTLSSTLSPPPLPTSEVPITTSTITINPTASVSSTLTPKPTSAIINVVYAMPYPVKPPGNTPLSTGIKAGIGVGSGVAAVAFGVLTLLLVLRTKRHRKDRTALDAFRSLNPTSSNQTQTQSRTLNSNLTVSMQSWQAVPSASNGGRNGLYPAQQQRYAEMRDTGYPAPLASHRFEAEDTQRRELQA